MFKKLEVWNNEELLRQVVKESFSIAEALRKLNVSEVARSNANNLKHSFEKFNIDHSHFRSQNTHQWTKENLEPLVKNNLCLSDILLDMGLSSRSGNYTTLKGKIEQYKIDTSHFDPVKAGQIKKIERGEGPIPLNEILEGKHPTYKTYHLKKRLLDSGIKQPVCEECGLKGIWNGKPIQHELDHINGVSTDHRLENLRLLCPNCHSQTPTFKGKNRRIPS